MMPGTTTSHRRRALLSLGFVLVGLRVVDSLAVETFPSRPIEVVTHSKAGGGTDMTARLMALGARESLGVDVGVRPQWGGAAARSHHYAAGRPRDGHTMLILTQTHLYTMARGASPLGIDDVVGLARAIDDPTIVVVPASSGYATLDDLIRASRREPLDWGVSNIGGTEHIGLARLARSAGFAFTAVPFGSGAQMVQAMLSRSVAATLANASEVAGLLDDGTVRGLAVLRERRLRARPGIPTSHELGHPVSASTTRGFWVLKGTPEDRVATLAAGVEAALRGPRFVEFLERSGLDPAESVAGAEAWNRQIRDEFALAVEALGSLGLLEE